MVEKGEGEREEGRGEGGKRRGRGERGGEREKRDGCTWLVVLNIRTLSPAQLVLL